MKKSFIVFIIILAIGIGCFYPYKENIRYILDYLYFVDVVEQNSFYLNNVPNFYTKKIYFNKLIDCNSMSDFYDILSEFSLNYEMDGHFGIVDNASYRSMQRIYMDLVKDGIVNSSNWNYQQLENQKVFDCYSKLEKNGELLDENSKKNVKIDCNYNNDFFVMKFDTFDINLLDSFVLIENQLQNFTGDKIIIDISNNKGGSDLIWQKLVSILSDDDYIYKTKIIGRGKLSKKYVDSYGINTIGDTSSFFYMDNIKIKTKGLYNFDNIYLIVNDETFSAADSFARFSKSTGFASVIGRETSGFGTSLDPMIVKLPLTNLLLVLDAVGKNPITTVPDYTVDDISVENVMNCILKNHY